VVFARSPELLALLADGGAGEDVLVRAHHRLRHLV
jgi:hypothetical protein